MRGGGFWPSIATQQPMDNQVPVHSKIFYFVCKLGRSQPNVRAFLGTINQAFPHSQAFLKIAPNSPSTFSKLRF